MVMPTNNAISNATTAVVSQNPPTSNEGKVGDKSVELATTGAQASKTASRTEVEAPQSASTKDIGAIDVKTKATPPETYPMIRHADLPKSTRLNQISMLGSHDAGTYAFSKQDPENKANSYKLGVIPSRLGTLMPGSFKTQNQNLVDQAKFGATYFDVRVKEHGKGEKTTFHFNHGPSSAGDAVQEFKELLKHAAGDKTNIFVVKLVIPNNAAGKNYNDKVFEGMDSHIITPQDIKALPGDKSHVGELTLEDTSKMGKNIVILYKNADKLGAALGNNHSQKEPQMFDYKSETVFDWPDTKSTSRVINSIDDQIKNAKADDLNKKIAVMQTNIPVGKKGVKEKLESSAGRLVEAMGQKNKPSGVISTDYIGHDKGTYQGFINIINNKNDKLIKDAAAEKK